MSSHADGRGAILRPLPGSERMVGGPHLCTFHEIEPPLQLDGWRCEAVYVHVAREPVRVYGAAECSAVQRAVHAMNENPRVAEDVLLRDAHAEGHPLPGVFTLTVPGYRVDMRSYADDDERGDKHLWAEVYRR